MPPTTTTDRPLWNPGDWWSDLIWPRVAGACVYGLRPGRVGLALFGLVLVVVLLAIGMSIDRAILGERTVAWPWLEWGGEHQALTTYGWDWIVDTPLAALTAYPVTFVIVGPVVLVVLVLAVGAISRGSAVEMATGKQIPWTEALSFAAARWRSLLGAVVGPWAIMWFVAVLLAAGGLLLRVPGLNILAAIGYGLAILAGVAVALFALGYALSHHLLIPAVVCDGADALDAIQRALAYAFGKPIRLLLYLVVGAGGAWLLFGVIVAVTGIGLGYAASSAGLLAGQKGSNLLWNGTSAALFAEAIPTGEQSDGSTFRAGAEIVRFWTGFTACIVLAIGIACFTSAMTGVYLGIRRAVDGQDMSDLYEPGQIEESMRQAMVGRSKVAGTTVPPTGSTPPPGDAP